jgi:hypothetical protein
MKRTAARFVLCFAWACGREEVAQAPPASSHANFHFVDIAREAGLSTPTWCGSPEKPHLLESLGNGLALFDYDLDGRLDIYLVRGWRLSGSTVVERGHNILYHNRGDGTFEDVTEKAGVGDDGWGCGVAVGDIDGDGYPDLFVTNFGPDVLYHNNGNGTFTKVPNGPSLDGLSTGAVFFDADGDGDLDLYICGYIDCTLEDVLHAERSLDWQDRKVMKGPFGLAGKRNRYFENLGNGTFRDVTEKAGLEDVGAYYSLGVVAADLDGDGDLDLFVANDSNPNYLYRNDGKGHFEEVGLWSGAGLNKDGAAQAGMGIAVGDIDGDGLPDLVLTTFAEDSASLYRNLGKLLFTDDTIRYGLRGPTYAPLKWGVALEDFDLDGTLDLFIANGHIYPQADEPPATGTNYRQANLLLTGEGGKFIDVSKDSGPGLAVIESSRGVAAGDIDGDGDIDLLISNIDAPPTLLRNDSPRRGNWLLVDAPGALRVTLEYGGRKRARDAVYGGSYLSVSDSRFHFGLGPVVRIDVLTARWPGGKETVLHDVETNRVVKVHR